MFYLNMREVVSIHGFNGSVRHCYAASRPQSGETCCLHMTGEEDCEIVFGFKKGFDRFFPSTDFCPSGKFYALKDKLVK